MQRVLAAGQARVEVSKTGNHEENEAGAGKNPGNVARTVCGDLAIAIGGDEVSAVD